LIECLTLKSPAQNRYKSSVGVNLSDTIRFNLDYSGLIGKRNDDHGGRATLNFKF
jgi:hypothetical protein